MVQDSCRECEVGYEPIRGEYGGSPKGSNPILPSVNLRTPTFSIMCFKWIPSTTLFDLEANHWIYVKVGEGVYFT